jgi:hypothetical protein
MTKIFRVFLLAAALMFVSQAQAFAGAQDFTIVNQTESAICNVYWCPAGTEDWEEYRLGDNGVIFPGESVTITFDLADRARYWNCRVVLDNEGGFFVEELDMESLTVLVLNNDGTTDFY